MTAPRHRPCISGLYIILDPSVCSAQSLADVLRHAAGAGARLVQYRNKTASMKEAYAEALPLRKLAAELGVDPPVEIADLLDATRNIAHNVSRPAAPLSLYVLGLAAASGVDQAELVARVDALVERWQRDDHSGIDE